MIPDFIRMTQLFKGIASEADALLSDLENSLHKQDEKLSAFSQQQREVCAAIEFSPLRSLHFIFI